MFLLACLNCNGLINQDKRRGLFSHVVKNKFDLVLLQETFWDQSIHDQAKLEWDGDILSSFYSPARRRGTSCLIRKGSDIDVHHFEPDINGRFLKLSITVDGQSFTVFNIYAPNTPSERKQFLEDISGKLRNVPEPIILAGDFNTVLNTYVDKYPSTPNPDSSRKSLKLIMSEYELVDIWRERHPSLIQFTRTASNHKTASRIDRFLLNKQLVRYVKSCSISRYPDSDHDMVELKLDFTLFPRGPGVWIFNNSILEDTSFCSEIRDLIEREKQKTCYDNNFLQWYDVLKDSLKRTAIKFTKVKSRLSRTHQRKLRKQINHERAKAQKYQDYDTTRLRNLEFQLDETTRADIRGAALRSRIKWFEEGERSSKFFLNLEKSRQSKKVMRQILTDEGAIINDQDDIIHEQSRFYRTLYTAEPSVSIQSEVLLSQLSKTLSEPDSQSCEGDISATELQKSLFDMESSKSPGLDGLTVEFYKEFWDVLGEVLFKLTKEIYKTNEMCNSMKTGLITLIPKKGDLRKLKNWRPISLLNTDYKIITKALANRISRVINCLVSSDQTCCVPGRDIADNVLAMRNIINYVNENKLEGYVLKIDQLKAFDRVNHEYLINVLQRMGFGTNLINWVKILYNDIQGCIKHNGYISDTFHIQRGVRQGCPISAILYVLSAEPFHDAIYKSKSIIGIEFMHHEAKMFQHADDTTFFLSDTSSVKSVKMLLTCTRAPLALSVM
ncbi:pol-like protein [Apostichopus japonicus]|uniref:Pol-like protein n=1 Tax=Stichopus japonicus TaxID=307972 RepID=A0A2G8LQH2_STIJA|nr:pol-like protein [Apostichopus japonicus]